MRHGQRLDHAKREFDMSGVKEEANSELSERGRRQAEVAGKQLRNYLQELGVRLSEEDQALTVVASPYWRCVQTADIVLRNAGFEVQDEGIFLTDLVQEIQTADYAQPKGALLRKIEENSESLQFKVIVDQFPQSNKKESETKITAFLRAEAFFESLPSTPLFKRSKIILVVTHAFMITSYIYLNDQKLYNVEIKECGLTVCKVSSAGENHTYETIVYNADPHLSVQKL